MNYIIHKPYGVVSQFVCDNHKKKMLGELYPFPTGTMAIGRLDEDSEGLLLLTQDGMTSEIVRSKKIEKEYYAQLDGIPTEEAIHKLQTGVEIGLGRGQKYKTKPCKVFCLTESPNFLPRTKAIRDDRHGPTAWVSITLTEGKNRQIRKMCAAAGFPVLRLFRVRIGNYFLGEMKSGEVKEIESFEF